jgi:hypothetical protein
LFALAFAAHAGAQEAAVAPQAGAPGIGPFRLGMGLDEVRAAAPAMAWRNVMVSRYTGRVFSLRSEDALPIGGVEFEVSALAHYYQHGLRIEGAAQVRDAAECEQVGLGVLTEIESQAGPFASQAPRSTPATGPGLSWQTQRSANGSITVMPAPGYGSPGRTEGETLKFGQASSALAEAFDDRYRPRPRQKLIGSGPAFLQLSAFNRGERHAVEAEVSYGRDGGNVCAVRVEMVQWTQPPLPQTFDTSQAKIAHEPSIAERHLVHAPLAAEKEQPPIDAELSCGIERATGLTFGCGVVHPDGIGLAQEQVAQNLARLMVYDTTGVDRDDPQMLRGTVRVRIDPAARKSLDFVGAPRTPLTDVEFLRQPDPAAPRLVLPRLPGNENADAAGEVEVRVACRIESDGSLICADPEAGADPERKAIVATACRVAATDYRAAPALRGGGSSAGRVIDLTLNVRPAF